MEELLDRCLGRPRPKVLVVGDVICDTYLWGKVHRISPEAPVPVFEGTERCHVLGGAANVAANLKALGCEVRLLGVVGADAVGRCLRELLHQRGISDTWLLQDESRPTTEKTRLMAQQQHVLRLDQESGAPLAPALIYRALEQAQALMQDVDGVVCSDYNKGVCTPGLVGPLFAMANTACYPIIVDPKVRDFSRYRGATMLTPNLAEVEQASGMTLGDGVTLAKAAGALLRQSHAQALLVTRGKDGMALFHPPEAPEYIAARAREVFDVTGAGDTVVATFSMALLCGVSPSDAARLANAAASVVVGKIGTAVVTPEELRAALRDENGPDERKVLGRHELAMAIQSHRQRGERIVFTNGCFDLLHVGHIRYLQQARALGKRLVVALNDDASVRLLKGEGRPLIPHEQRARLIAALACVDYVTIFSEATPVPLIKLLQPDVVVKGGDYTSETVVGRDEVEAYGGNVHIVPFVADMSTTALVDRIVYRYGRQVAEE
jgi:D-beta-D-heptose 7-phosphate kinase / D-beta-D-heptose 1-phosphate adenosyltransferase